MICSPRGSSGCDAIRPVQEKCECAAVGGEDELPVAPLEDEEDSGARK